MISGSTFGFVLALCAVALAAAALTISLTSAAALKRLHATAEKNFERELAELRKQTPVKLAAEVAELSDAVARLADTHRRFAGKIWAHVGHDQKIGISDGNGASDATDDELSAMLALQKAASPSR